MHVSIRFLSLFLTLVGTLGIVGLVHGIWTGRWESPDDPQVIAALDKWPLSIGPWKGNSADVSTVYERANNAGIVGVLLTRQYFHQENGDVVSVLLSRGRSGPMVIRHLPTECYISNGFELEGQPKKIVVDRSGGGPADEFWAATFKKTNEANPERVRVYWSWSANGQWRTPDRPRLEFAGDVLHKVQVVYRLTNEQQSLDGRSIRDFLRDMTQAMRSSLLASASN